MKLLLILAALLASFDARAELPEVPRYDLAQANWQHVFPGSMLIKGVLRVEKGLQLTTGTLTLPTGSVTSAQVLNNTLDYADLSDTLTMDATTTVNLGTVGISYHKTDGSTVFAITGTNFIFEEFLYLQVFPGIPNLSTKPSGSFEFFLYF